MGNLTSSKFFTDTGNANPVPSITKKIGDYDLHPLSDPVFQRWMGDQKICALFLKSLFNEDFSDITVSTQTEVISPEPKLKKIRLDVTAKQGNVRIYNIEAQRKYYQNHKDRCLFYACKQIVSQLEVKMTFEQIKKTVVIFINQKNPDSSSLVEYVFLREQETNFIYNDKLEIININLNHLDDGLKDSKFADTFKYFAAFCLVGHNDSVFNAYQEKYNLKLQALQQEITEKFRQMAGDYTLQEALRDYHNLNNDIDKEAYTMDALEAAVLTGMEKGMEKGMDKGKVLVYNEFGLDKKEIAERVGVSVDEVYRIIKEAGIAS
ncbi:MAG: Rpn family recombination-promoting nuclease/putative transposase [Clostridiales bacterium]|jgi:predicted transposase/invertase (TIGR01784 family)|nr:Rpn family recombination-promoting nuclease/putative transposase [Clostridiales bacterium]